MSKMNRNEFLKTCGYACLGTLSVGLILQSCMTTKSINAALEGDKIRLPIADFQNKGEFYKYLMIRNPQISYPIVVFRFSEKEYTALYLQCTHQGNEVNAYGDKLVCEAHGSEFDNRGNVTNGPAAKPLHSFPIQINPDEIIISITQS